MDGAPGDEVATQSQTHRGLDARASNPKARVKAGRVYHPKTVGGRAPRRVIRQFRDGTDRTGPYAGAIPE
jgi:hypothetical protein